jgi:outer membrane protein TolC
MRYFYIGLMLVGISALGTPVACAQTAPTDTLTMERVVQEVVRNNDRLKAAVFLEEAARREIGPAGAWDDPMLMLGVQNLPPSFRFDEEMMTMKMIGLSQRIPYAGEKGLQAKSKRAAADAVLEERHQTALDLVAAAKSAYVELYYHQRVIDDLENQRELTEQIAVSVRSRVESGQAGMDELNSALAAMWRLDAEILTHHNDAHTAHHRLDALRGVVSPDDMPAVAPPEVSALPDTFLTWTDSARVYYAPLRQMLNQAESYRLSALASSRMSWPMLELSASYGIREDLVMDDGMVTPQDNMWNFGATFSLPIFKGRQEKQMAHSMTAMQRQMEAEATQMAKDVDAELRALHMRAEHFQEAAAMYEQKIIPADEEAFRSALSGYSAGKTSLPDLLNYATTIYRDKTTLTDLQLAYAISVYEAERYITDGRAYFALTTD